MCYYSRRVIGKFNFGKIQLSGSIPLRLALDGDRSQRTIKTVALLAGNLHYVQIKIAQNMK